MRAALRTVIMALVIVTGLNSVAMASSVVAHSVRSIENTGIDIDLHDHDGGQSQASEHDHEACLPHVCMALLSDIGQAHERKDSLLATVHVGHPLMRETLRVESLHRPPSL